ncbi:MAG: thioredoxin fold domain-containing protein [Muribaculaceae bacterium]|nr:thioredoxin fold domain-containing protein [Muribaculaceae bacterium]
MKRISLLTIVTAMVMALASLTANAAGPIPKGVRELPAGQTIDLKKAPGHLVIVDFNASWCGPCQRFAPIFADAAKTYAGKVEFISVDIDKHPALRQQLGIQSIPYLLFIQPDGKMNVWNGFLPADAFNKAIDQFLGPDKNE